MRTDPGPEQHRARLADAVVRQAGELRVARVESLRALAVLGVVVAHALYWAPIRGDALANVTATVTQACPFVLFVLSGCLLYAPFVRRDFASGPAVDLSRYATNRAVRILPVYYAGLVLALVLHGEFGTPRDWALYATFTQNFVIFPNQQVNRVMWFMVIEAQFYVVLPVLAFLLAAVARGSRRRAAVALGALAAASWVLFRYVWHVDATPAPAWRFSLPSTFFFLAAGMALALLRQSWQERPPSWLRGPLGASDLWVLLAVVLWALAVLRREAIPSMTAMGLVLAISVALVGACVLPLRPGPLVGALRWRPLAVLGVASYSLLLCHDPILRALVDAGAASGWHNVLALGLPLSLLVTTVLYAAVEAPFLRLRRRWSGR